MKRGGTVEVMRFLVKHTSIETTYVHYDFQHSSFYRIVCDIAESVKCNPSPPFPDSQTTPHHIFLVPVNLGVLSLSIKNHTPTHHRAGATSSRGAPPSSHFRPQRLRPRYPTRSHMADPELMGVL
jgi:hypothetical protein